MRFMYVDESGDPGILNPALPTHKQPSKHYILTGFILPSGEWHQLLQRMVTIRRYCREKYGLQHRIELHGAKLINPGGSAVYRVLGSRRVRVALYREVLMQVRTSMPNCRIINIHLDKQHPEKSSGESTKDIQRLAWDRLIQRFHTYLKKTCSSEQGIIFADATNEVKIRGLLRKKRVFNPVPSHYGGTYSAPVDLIVEDPVMRDSRNSYFVQIADLVCHSLYQKIYPRGSLRKFGVDKLFDEVSSLCLKEASPSDPFKLGIVHL